MLTKVIKMYTMAMATGVTSPMPHFVGPPGSGKSTIFQQAAELLGVNLHVINVSRMSPLEVEGTEIPVEGNTRLELLLSETWAKAQEGDIYLFDEFLRGFPEVYNGLLDILTSRNVAGRELPRVFFAGASNSVAAYDGALEDRLLHIRVPDPRKKKGERNKLAKLVVDQLGLLPGMEKSSQMQHMLDKEVLPTFELLDQFEKKANRATSQIEGSSVRKLIGQAMLREVQSPALRDLLNENNNLAVSSGKLQYMFLLYGHNLPRGAESGLKEIDGNAKLTPLQQMNVSMNLQLISMASATTKEDEQEGNEHDIFNFS